MVNNEITGEQPLPASVSHLFFARVLIIVSLVVIFNLWLVRHTGFGLVDPRFIGGVGGVLFFAFGLCKSVISTADEERWKIIVRRAVTAILDFRLLAGLYVVAVFAMLTISSVTIISDPGEQGRKAVLQPVDTTQNAIELDLDSQATRRWVWVSPFGRIYGVMVDGYLPNSIEVYPLLGATVHPQRDLQRSPTILIRPSIKALQSLKQCETGEGQPEASVRRCGWFRLCEVDQSGDCMEIARIAGHSSAFLIGWPQAMPQGIMQDWRLELTISGVSKAPEIEAATIKAWKEPKLLSPDALPKVGSQLRAEVYTKSREKEIVADKTFTVTNTPFIDILMETITRTGATNNAN